MPSFDDFSLLPTLVASLGEQNLTRPTEIQARSLSPLLEGQSLIGVSETGSGKTLAYVLPMLDQLKRLEANGTPVSTSSRPRGLVLVPGRELGGQVSKVFKGLTHGTRLRVRSALGGSPKQIARQNVSGNFEILVATPGRLLQLLDSRELYLDDLRMLVFDEADQLVDPGFLPVALRIVSDCSNRTQIVMFSATLPQSLELLVDDLFVTTPVRVRTRGSQHVVPTLEVDNRAVSSVQRFEVLSEVLKDAPDMGTLLFSNTRRQCEQTATWLEEEGIGYVTYMGEMDRQERRVNLAAFRDGQVSVLIATDLGARGLDIERVERVINVHMPKEVNNYLHRVGRTARAGRAGLVVNLVTQRDQPLLAKLRKGAGKRR